MLSVLSQFGVIFKSSTCSVYPLTWVVNTRIGQKPCEHSPFNIFFYADHSLLGHQPIRESNLDRVSMASGYAIGYPKLWIYHNDTNTLYCLHSKVLSEVNIYNICCFPHIHKPSCSDSKEVKLVWHCFFTSLCWLLLLRCACGASCVWACVKCL